ncbi:MAG: ribosomal protein S18-alanine N-acetyltransferase [Clostridia bacterium]|nr:ribosomal protein S18-alanine N-acetyltransferase [Clostridia bacterium]
MRIERFKKEHIPALCELETQCFGTVAWSESAFESELYKEDAIFLCALEGDTLIGCAALNYAAGQGFISKVMVVPAFRRQGIAKALLEQMIRVAKENGIYELTLEVRASNEAAIALYEALGFENLGIRRNFYRLPKEDAVIMTKQL